MLSKTATQELGPTDGQFDQHIAQNISEPTMLPSAQCSSLITGAFMRSFVGNPIFYSQYMEDAEPSLYTTQNRPKAVDMDLIARLVEAPGSAVLLEYHVALASKLCGSSSASRLWLHLPSG